MMQGKIGKKKIIWKSTPQGKIGEGIVSVDGREIAVRWSRDGQGIWIETNKGFFGYDVRKTVNDENQSQYLLLSRNNAEMSLSGGFLKAGEDQGNAVEGKTKKAYRLKSQMPGKIVQVLVKVGDAVKKGQALIVMEAMKMENEIKAAQEGVIKEIKVIEGQAIETGSELLSFQ